VTDERQPSDATIKTDSSGIREDVRSGTGKEADGGRENDAAGGPAACFISFFNEACSAQ
jgi:hypothetical protein